MKLARLVLFLAVAAVVTLIWSERLDREYGGPVAAVPAPAGAPSSEGEGGTPEEGLRAGTADGDATGERVADGGPVANPARFGGEGEVDPGSVRVQVVEISGLVRTAADGVLRLRALGVSDAHTVDVRLESGELVLPEDLRAAERLQLVGGTLDPAPREVTWSSIEGEAPVFAAGPLDPTEDWALALGTPVRARAVDRETGESVAVRWYRRSHMGIFVERDFDGRSMECWGPLAERYRGWLVHEGTANHPRYVAAAEGYVPHTVARKELPVEGELAVSLSRAATLRVAYHLDLPVDRFGVHAQPLAEGVDGVSRLLSGTGGEERVEGLLPGRYRVLLQTHNQAMAERIVDVPLEGARVEFDLRDEQEDLHPEVELVLRFESGQGEAMDALRGRGKLDVRIAGTEALRNGGKGITEVPLSKAVRVEDRELRVSMPRPMAPGEYRIDVARTGHATKFRVEPGEAQEVVLPVPYLSRVRAWVEQGGEAPLRVRGDEGVWVELEREGRKHGLLMHEDSEGLPVWWSAPGVLHAGSIGANCMGTTPVERGEVDLHIFCGEELELRIEFAPREGQAFPSASQPYRHQFLLGDEPVADYRFSVWMDPVDRSTYVAAQIHSMASDGDYELTVTMDDGVVWRSAFTLVAGVPQGGPPKLVVVE